LRVAAPFAGFQLAADFPYSHIGSQLYLGQPTVPRSTPAAVALAVLPLRFASALWSRFGSVSPPVVAGLNSCSFFLFAAARPTRPALAFSLRAAFALS